MSVFEETDDAGVETEEFFEGDEHLLGGRADVVDAGGFELDGEGLRKIGGLDGGYLPVLTRRVA